MDVPNYDAETVLKVAQLYRESNLNNPAIIIDTNHSNSAKRHLLQMKIACEVMQDRRFNAEHKAIVKGL